MKNVLEWLENDALNHPNEVVYESDGYCLTFGQVQDLAKRIGSNILAHNKGKKPIATMLGRGAKTITAYLGIVYSGCAYAPIDPLLPDHRLKGILTKLSPEILITNEVYRKKAEKIIDEMKMCCSVLTYEETINTEIDGIALSNIRSQMVSSDPLYIIFTSGSSGAPKGVITSHLSLINYIRAYADMMGITSEDRLGNQSPLDYIAAIRDIYVPLYKGAYSYIIPRELFMQPSKMVNVLNEKKITSIGWSASALTVLSRMNIFKNDTPRFLKKICFSGSVLPTKILREWQLNLPDSDFVNQYGPTEATASCTFYRCTHVVNEGENIPIGIPYNNYRIFLIKSDNTSAGKGEIGEICVGGPVLALGYYGDPMLTRKSFTQNPLHDDYIDIIYKTGDLGLMRENGDLEFHGRIDRQIKYLGHRVELEEIESASILIEGVQECAVVFVEEAEVIVLFYIGIKTEKDIAVELRKKLPGFMVPRKIVRLDEMPKLPNGKIDLQLLKHSYERK